MRKFASLLGSLAPSIPYIDGGLDGGFCSGLLKVCGSVAFFILVLGGSGVCSLAIPFAMSLTGHKRP